MPDYPVLSGSEIVRALERLGFRHDRQNGSHLVMKRNSVGCVGPMHREVRRGTLASIVKQAKIDPVEFIAALKH